MTSDKPSVILKILQEVGFNTKIIHKLHKSTLIKAITELHTTIIAPLSRTGEASQDPHTLYKMAFSYSSKKLVNEKLYRIGKICFYLITKNFTL